ncbi:SDR family NAD(P)-dependent oxidoreductase [Sphingobacterium sp. lm-10]|uniref:SDR family NAD(P)-dependent oxidoreductase n=1 Tax=Sphingobacterium sp. lm-10 TaxID=2944904 RepID=UPI002022529C|nr:SDR family NAD(P)-dependent oxidoreductase [Sphingobacterium sp. lm-10]MCL7987250.1 SDR family NAD(P)-dependent oxidoreductase [Sphingobacterium sp. lm-10]
MKKAFITGANKGIGFETAKELLKAGFYVYLGSRDLGLGQAAVDRLNAVGFDQVTPISLDVTDEASIREARQRIGDETDVLDVLINNAGINGGTAPFTVLEATASEYLAAFHTNVVGTAEVTKALMDLLRKAPAPRVVNVSTSVGSLTLQSNPDWPAYHYAKYGVYATSKAALNMYTIHLAYELRDTAFKVNAVCPGYTSTDFTGHQGDDVGVAAKRIAKYALIGEDGPTGKFFSEETNPITGEIAW